MERHCPWPVLLGPLHEAFLQKLFVGAFPPTVGLILLAGSTLAVPEGPTFTAIWTSCWVGDDLGDLPASSNFATSFLLLLSTSSCEEGVPVWILFSGLFLSYSILVFCFSVLASNHILGLPHLSTSFFSGFTSAAMGKFPQERGRPPMA